MFTKHPSIQCVFFSAQVPIPKDLRGLETAWNCVAGWSSMIPGQTTSGQAEETCECGTHTPPCLLPAFLSTKSGFRYSDLNHLVLVFPLPYHFNSSALEFQEGNSGSRSKPFNWASLSTKHSSHAFHFSFGPYSTPVGSVVFIPFYRWRLEAPREYWSYPSGHYSGCYGTRIP